jgi:hypothetical protein
MRNRLINDAVAEYYYSHFQHHCGGIQSLTNGAFDVKKPTNP